MAAVFLTASNCAVLKNPHKLPVLRERRFDTPDPFNARLQDLKEILAPIDSALPRDIPLRYLSENENNYQFEFIQAVVAPRRIAPEVKSPFILVVSVTDQWLAEQQELKRARPLIRLPWRIMLFQKEVTQ